MHAGKTEANTEKAKNKRGQKLRGELFFLNFSQHRWCEAEADTDIHALVASSCLSAVRQRDEWEKRRRMKIQRERGWTGNSWGGISLGPPDPGPNGGKQQ